MPTVSKKRVRKAIHQQRDEIFAQAYVIHGNARLAAKKAGYSEKSAHQIGYTLLKQPYIAMRIDQLMKEKAEKMRVTGDRVLKELCDIAMVRVKDCYDEEGNLLNLHEMPEANQAALSSVETDEIYAGHGTSRKHIGKARKIKLSDKMKALEILAKHFHLYAEHIEHSGPNGGPQVVLTLPANDREAPRAADLNDNKAPDIDPPEE